MFNLLNLDSNSDPHRLSLIKISDQSKLKRNTPIDMNRSKQRFDNFEQALLQLREALLIANPSLIELAGSIKLFELAFELGWKTIKDILEQENLFKNEIISSPRRVIKIAVQCHFLEEAEGQIWLEALDNRNLFVHTYNYGFAEQCKNEIHYTYYPLLEKLLAKVKSNFYE